MENTFEPGDKVCYIPPYDKAPYENGVVKGLSNDKNYAFVVFKCGDDWENYQDYTASRTNIKRLEKGWYNKYTDEIK